MMFKILILIPVYKRPEIFKICAAGIKSLMAFAPNIIDIKCMVIISKEDSYYARNVKIAKDAGFEICIYNLSPAFQIKFLKYVFIQNLNVF